VVVLVMWTIVLYVQLAERSARMLHAKPVSTFSITPTTPSRRGPLRPYHLHAAVFSCYLLASLLTTRTDDWRS